MQIAIVLYDGMTALDAVGPYEVFRFLPDVELRFVSDSPRPIMTDSGVLVLGATHSYEETRSPEIVLVPGSSADTTTAMADASLIAWLQTVHKTSKLTLSVCSGALILGAAGILDGHPATTHWIAQKALGNFGAKSIREKRVVRSGKIITGAGVSAGIDLALSIIVDLYGMERAEVIQLLIEYDPHPPVDSGHPSKASKKVYRIAKAEMLAEGKNIKNMVSIPKILWRNALNRVRKRLGRN